MKTFNRQDEDEMRLLKAYADDTITKDELLTIPKEELIQKLKSIPMFRVHIIRASDNALVNPDGSLYTPEQLAEYEQSLKENKHFNVNFNQ